MAVMDSEDKGFVHCTGSLVASQWILTAKHCVKSPILAEAYADLGAGPSYRFPLRITAIVKHPRYDVALLKLNRAQTVTVAELDASLPFNGTRADFFGFGGSNILTQSTLKIVGTSQDEHVFGRAIDGSKSVIGDSGGPLMINNKLTGVLSAAVNVPYESFVKEDFKFVPTAVFSKWLYANLGLNRPQYNIAPAAKNPAPASTIKHVPVLPPATPSSEKYRVQNHATQSNAPNRIAGADRVQTALKVWELGGLNSDTVVIATGKNAADALAAGPLAASMNAPLLLSTAETIEPAIVSHVQSRGIKNIYLVGGGLKFDSATQANLHSRGIRVVALSGSSRYETAVIAAKTAIGAWKLQGKTPHLIFLADGTSFSDALSAGAAAANLHGVVVLTSATSMPPATANFLQEQAPASPRLIAVGGPAFTAWNASKPGGIPAFSVVGADRYQTATLLGANLLPLTTSAIVVSAYSFPDGLAAAPLALKRNARLLLSAPAQLPGETSKALSGLPLRNSSLVIGGTAVVSDAVAWAVRG